MSISLSQVMKINGALSVLIHQSGTTEITFIPDEIALVFERKSGGAGGVVIAEDPMSIPTPFAGGVMLAHGLLDAISDRYGENSSGILLGSPTTSQITEMEGVLAVLLMDDSGTIQLTVKDSNIHLVYAHGGKGKTGKLVITGLVTTDDNPYKKGIRIAKDMQIALARPA